MGVDGAREMRGRGREEETKRKSRSPRQRLEMLAGVRPVLALIFVPLFTQPPRQTIYHNEGNGSLEQNSLTPGESLQQWFCPPFLSHPRGGRGGPSFLLHALLTYHPLSPCFTRPFRLLVTLEPLPSDKEDSNRANLSRIRSNRVFIEYRFWRGGENYKKCDRD